MALLLFVMPAYPLDTHAPYHDGHGDSEQHF
jgi:hypothetical protein